MHEASMSSQRSSFQGRVALSCAKTIARRDGSRRFRLIDPAAPTDYTKARVTRNIRPY